MMTSKKELISESYDKYFNEIEEIYKTRHINGTKYVKTSDAYMFSLKSDINEFVFNEMLESDIEDVVLETITEDYKEMYETLERLVLKVDGSDFHWEDYRLHLLNFEYGKGVE